LSETREECKHVKEWVENIYFLSTNQFSYSKMLEGSNNMVPQRRYNEIVNQLRIMNQRMDQMVNDFRDRLDKLERKCVNDHDGVQNRSE
jgi:hypothetical protein